MSKNLKKPAINSFTYDPGDKAEFKNPAEYSPMWGIRNAGAVSKGVTGRIPTHPVTVGTKVNSI